MSTTATDAGPQADPQDNQQSSRKTSRVLACSTCHRRKVKCDRNSPCSNCLKANVPCTQLVSAPTRKKKVPNRYLRERLVRCEALLEQYALTCDPPDDSNVDLASPSSTLSVLSPSSVAASAVALPSSVPHSPKLASCSSSPAPTPILDDGATERNPVGRLIWEEGSVKFLNSKLWASVHAEVRAMRQILVAGSARNQNLGDTDAVEPDGDVDVHIGFAAADLEDFVPNPLQIFTLWHVFLDRVNPLTKIVHVPTLQPRILEATKDYRNVPNNTQALFFAIFLISVLTMTDDESKRLLHISREEALKKFTAGVQSALTKANFLKQYDMIILQALTLYLMSLQERHDRDESWVLSGVMLRIACKMGLHRDGETLGLPPFETEMRRRAWWQIIMLDSTFAITSGFSDPELTWEWDTIVPLNVNDADLFPNCQGPLQPHEGPTEMVFCILICEMWNFISRIRFFELERLAIFGQGAEPGTPAYTSTLASMQTFSARVDELEAKIVALEQRYCDPSAGSVHQVASRIRSLIIGKIRCVLVPMRETPEWGTEVNNIQDNLFRISLCRHEITCAFYDVHEIRDYFWFIKVQFQLDAFTFFVGQLLNRAPTGDFADRAWRIIDRVYRIHEELWDMAQENHVQLACFVTKTWRCRESAFAKAALHYDVPTCIPKLQECQAQSTFQTIGSLAQLVPLGVVEDAGPKGLQMDSSGASLDTCLLDGDTWAWMNTAIGGGPSIIW